MTRTIWAARPAVAIFGLGLLALAGCGRGTVQDALGMGKRAPDEFAVVARAPLIVPPDFELRPPRPGEVSPVVGTSGAQARATLLGQPQGGSNADPLVVGGSEATGGLAAGDGQTTDPTSSTGQQALLAEAGGGAVDPNIRQQIAQENQSLAQVEQAMFTRVMQWREPSTVGATVDAQAETERLRANRIEGQPVTAGDTPTVVQRRQSPLGALIDKVF